MSELLLPYVLALVINEKKQVLLSYRSLTQWFDNHYGLIGGKIEEKEFAKGALSRELFEEIGITVQSRDMDFVHVMHFMGETRACVAFFFLVRTWQGTIVNKEIKKCDHIKWFDLDQLPENMIPRHRIALNNIQKRIVYSEVDR